MCSTRSTQHCTYLSHSHSDAHNVARVSDYIRQHAHDQVQFIVISLKASLYERSQALVGVYRNQDRHTSACITLDLEQYA